MKHKFIKTVLSGVAVTAMGAAMVAGFTGCGDETVEISIDGSTSVTPLMQTLAAAYEEQNENVQINITGNGSGTGISDAISGKVDIGMSSRNLKDSEMGVESKKIADDGIAVIVNSAASLTNVTKAQLLALYSSGTEFSGIKAGISRSAGSGTRSAFEELIGIESLYSGQGFEEIDSTNNVIVSIAGNTACNTIGYISMGSLKDATGCKAVQYEGVDATTANVSNGTYALSRPFIICYQAEKYTGEVKNFIDFIMGTEGQKIVSDSGYISIV